MCSNNIRREKTCQTRDIAPTNTFQAVSNLIKNLPDMKPLTRKFQTKKTTTSPQWGGSNRASRPGLFRSDLACLVLLGILPCGWWNTPHFVLLVVSRLTQPVKRSTLKFPKRSRTQSRTPPRNVRTPPPPVWKPLRSFFLLSNPALLGQSFQSGSQGLS